MNTETIATDLWNANILLVKGPETSLINDRFHLIKYLYHGIDQVRRRGLRQYTERLNRTTQKVETIGRGHREFENFWICKLFCKDLDFYPKHSRENHLKI